MRIWLLLDLEPLDFSLDVGTVLEAAVVWHSADDLPEDVISRNLPAHTEPTPANGPREYERIAHIIDSGISALLPSNYADLDSINLSGCLVYDRYLSLFNRLVSTVRGRIVRRAKVAQPVRRTSTQDAGWYESSTFGKAVLIEFAELAPEGTVIVWRAVQLDTNDVD